MRNNAEPTWWEELIGLLLVGTGLLVWWLMRHPRCLALAVLIPVSVWRLGPTTARDLWFVVVLLLGAWWVNHPRSFKVVVGAPVRSEWRRWWVYARRWSAAMDLGELSKSRHGGMVRPRLGKVRADRVTDLVEVRMRAGQDLDHWERHATELANTFGAESCRVRQDRSGRLVLEFRTWDTLTNVVRPFVLPDEVDLYRVPVGVTDLGDPYRLRLPGRHHLVAGATGAGKSDLLAATLCGVAPAINAGLVQPWMCDPKEGMEGAFFAPLLARLEHETAAMIGLLEDAVAFKTERGNRLRGHTREHVPTVDDPLLLVVIDEIAALTHVLGDKKQKERADQLIRTLLQQGRALGVSVFGSVIDPSKDGLPYRHLFPVRIGLRLIEPTEADMVLGQGARNRGALCDRIPESLPGVGYVLLDGRREPTRIRIAHITDGYIRAVDDRYPINPHPDAIEAEVIELHPHDEDEETA